MSIHKKFLEPEDFQWGTFKNKKGAEIRYGYINPEEGDVKATIIMAPGYGEPIEKFFEVVHELEEKGYAVWMMDWRGQGGSERLYEEHYQKPYDAPDFLDDHVEDLNQFVTDIVEHDKNQALLFMGFSMGGHIGLKFLKKHDDVFDAAVLNAAMIDVDTKPIPRVVARILSWFMSVIKKSHHYAPGKSGDWVDGVDVFEGNWATSDPKRFKVLPDLFREKAQLRTGSQTMGWFHHADKSIRKMNKKKYLESIKTPIMFYIPMQDDLVKPEAQIRAANIIPNAEHHISNDSKHEIAMEKDSLRNHWVEKVEIFFDKQVKMKESKSLRKKLEIKIKP